LKIATDVLRRFVDAPRDPASLRHLLDDCGLEVKRAEPAGDDVVFTLELLANRGDHHCYEGVARELSGRTGAATCGPTVAEVDVVDASWAVVETTLCPRYSLTLISGAGGSLSADALRVLQAAGLHAVSAPVDATNVANLEIGQPTHAFDADKVVGMVRVRLSVAGERCWPLFTAGPVDLPAGTMVIADDEKVLAVAGVIGCEEAKTTETTTRVLLESAAFDPVAVRKASRALGIHTDSSARFERGSDVQRVLSGAGRVVYLLEQAGWRREGPTQWVDRWRDPGRVIVIQLDALNEFLATSLSQSEVIERLSRYGFGVDACAVGALSVAVPSWRLWDVEFAADLYEEVAKSVGYNATPIGLPAIDMGSRPQRWERRRDAVEGVLLGQGFYEVFTDGFYGRSALDLLGLDEDHPLFAHVQTTNALDRGYSFLKNNALAQAVEAIAINERRRTFDVKMYEWTRTFHPRGGLLSARAGRDAPPCDERGILWMIVSGHDRPKGWAHDARPADVYFLKGVVEELAAELGLDLALGGAGPHPLSSALHPRRQSLVLLDGVVVGVMGEVHPDVCERAKIKVGRPVYLELDRAALLMDGARPRFEEPSASQPVVRSLAFTLPHFVEAGAVQAFLHASGDDDLRRVRIVDLYHHGEGERTVTFELIWGDPTTSAEATNAALQGLVASVVEQFGDAGVRLR